MRGVDAKLTNVWVTRGGELERSVCCGGRSRSKSERLHQQRSEDGGTYFAGITRGTLGKASRTAVGTAIPVLDRLREDVEDAVLPARQSWTTRHRRGARSRTGAGSVRLWDHIFRILFLRS